MPRHLRHHRPGGWYHITTRGLGRRTLFHTDRDREHFVGLLEGMVERYRIVLHAFVLLGNHYHLLLESPEGNVSRAMQWLNTSYLRLLASLSSSVTVSLFADFRDCLFIPPLV